MEEVHRPDEERHNACGMRARQEVRRDDRQGYVKNEPDPYAGKGNAKLPGVLYYKLQGNTPPHSGPILPPLTNSDHHFYQGLDPEF
jgi:hypothetical protein